MDSWIKDLWNKNKVLFFLLIPLVLLAFFRSTIIGLLIKDSRKIEADTENKNSALLKQETEANSKANQLVEDSKALSENKPKVDEDWYKNGK